VQVDQKIKMASLIDFSELIRLRMPKEILHSEEIIYTRVLLVRLHGNRKLLNGRRMGEVPT